MLVLLFTGGATPSLSVLCYLSPPGGRGVDIWVVGDPPWEERIISKKRWSISIREDMN
jgi:hypothetical protein